MSETRSPIEVTTKFATTVAELADAWTFVMERVDQVGPDPHITVSPVWTIHADGVDLDPSPRHFEVVVSGMVEEKEGEE